MSFKYAYIALFYLCQPCASAYGQQESDAQLTQVLEYIAENLPEDYDYAEIAERLSFYKAHPMSINKVQRADLEGLLFLSPIQIDNLLSHREKSGSFIDLLELQAIQGFDASTITWLNNFVKLDPQNILENVSLGRMIKDSRHDLILRFGKIMQKQNGFLASDQNKPAYHGSELRTLGRYRYNYKNRIFALLNFEKDAGESAIDFYSGSVSVNHSGLLRKIVVGDYALQFGQGLTLWSGLGFGKGAGFAMMVKQDVGLRNYSSVNESSFFRGLSVAMQYKQFSLTPFVSNKQADASFSDDGREVKSLIVSGLHRTESERLTKNSITQLVYGFNTQYEGSRIRVGLTAYRTRFSMPLAAGNSLYEKYNFQGSSLINLGLHYNYSFRNSYFFGEAAHSLSSGYAYLNGLISSLSNQISIMLLQRNYQKDYYSPFNQAISESTHAANEKGFYSGISVKLNKTWEFSGYSDLFSYPWLKFRVDAPSRGYELFGQLSYEINKKSRISLRVKQQVRQENGDEPDISGGLDEVHRSSFRFELNYTLGKDFTWRNRAEMAIYRKEMANPEHGFLCYEDLIYNPLGSAFSGNIRFAIFDTSGFNSRIYAYENDVLYGYSIPAYQNKGIRYYMNVRYTFARRMDLWLRYASLNYIDQETVGSGNDQISGKQRSDIRLQLRFQF